MQIQELELLPDCDFASICCDIVLDGKFLFCVGSYRSCIKIYNLTEQSKLIDRNIRGFPIKVIIVDSLFNYYILTLNKLEVHNRNGLERVIGLPFNSRCMTKYKNSVLIGGDKTILKIVNFTEKEIKIPTQAYYLMAEKDYFVVASLHFLVVYKEEFILTLKLTFEEEITALTVKNNFIYLGLENEDNFLLIKMDLNGNIIIITETKSRVTLIKYVNDILIVVLNNKLYIFKDEMKLKIDLDYQITTVENDGGILFLGTFDGDMKIFYLEELGTPPEWCSSIIKIN